MSELVSRIDAHIERYGALLAKTMTGPLLKECRDALVEAQKLNEDYDDALRSLAFHLGAGGYNSPGLIDPRDGNGKVLWGIDNMCKVERERALASAQPQQQKG